MRITKIEELTKRSSVIYSSLSRLKPLGYRFTVLLKTLHNIIVPRILQVFFALYENNITPLKGKALDVLTPVFELEIETMDPKQTVGILLNIGIVENIEYNFDLNKLQSNYLKVPVAAKSSLVLAMIDRAQLTRRNKIKLFHWSLLTTYQESSESPPVKHFAASVLLSLLARGSQSPESIGLDFTDHAILFDSVEILDFLLSGNRISDEDSLSDMLAIVALMISDLGEFPLNAREKIKLKLLNPIEKLRESNSEKVNRLATDLSRIIITAGSYKPDIEVSKTNAKATKESTCQANENAPMAKLELADWIKHLSDPILPVRAGALREVTKGIKLGLISRKGKHNDDLFSKIEESAYSAIRSQEPFLFLSGIEALSTLALDNERIMKDLVEVFIKRFTQRSNPLLALQAGEILTRMCSRFGDMSAHYAFQLVPVVLSAAGSTTKIDPLLRSSAISAAAELVPLLGFYLHDIQVWYEYVIC